jgi:Holliday junction resolvase RusA-like endonuclease
MKLVIPGNTPSQKNNKEIAFNRATGRRFVRSNDRVTAWKEIAVTELQKQFRGYQVTDYPITIALVFFFDNLRRHDLDNAASGVMDALVAAEVITDDNVNYIDCLTLQYGGHDKLNPRCEVFLDE